MSSHPARVDAYRFGPFRLRVADRILERDGQRIQLTPKVIDTLFVMVENAGQLVTKEGLMKAVWPDVTVVESGLTRNISVLRKALEEGQAEGACIETIPKRGYRFVSPVTLEFAPVPDGAAAPTRRYPVSLLRLALVACVLAEAAVVWSLLRKPAVPRPDPYVSIGEHLLYKLAPGETVRAVEHFQQAIAARPNSAGAHAGLSIARIVAASLGMQPPAESLAAADEAASRALALDSRSAPAHYAAAMVHTFRHWNFAAADAEFRRALELEPDSVQARLGYARLKSLTGRPREALRLIEEALAMDPASPALGLEYCRLFYRARDFHRAASECRKVLDREAGYALAHYYLGLSLGWLGRIGDAGQSLDRSGLMPGVIEADRAWLSLLAGNRGPALAVLERRRQLIREGGVDATAKLLLATLLGLYDEAFEAMEKGLATRAPELLSVDEDPRLDPLRSDARYLSVLRRIGIGPQP